MVLLYCVSRSHHWASASLKDKIGLSAVSHRWALLMSPLVEAGDAQWRINGFITRTVAADIGHPMAALVFLHPMAAAHSLSTRAGKPPLWFMSHPWSPKTSTRPGCANETDRCSLPAMFHILGRLCRPARCSEHTSSAISCLHGNTDGQSNFSSLRCGASTSPYL